MRCTGGLIAAISRPWYLRVLHPGRVDVAYPPMWFTASHSRENCASSESAESSIGSIAILRDDGMDVTDELILTAIGIIARIELFAIIGRGRFSDPFGPPYLKPRYFIWLMN